MVHFYLGEAEKIRDMGIQTFWMRDKNWMMGRRAASTLAYPLLIQGANLSLSQAIGQSVSASSQWVDERCYHEVINQGHLLMRHRFIGVKRSITLGHLTILGPLFEPMNTELVEPLPLTEISRAETSNQSLSRQNVEEVLFLGRVFKNMGRMTDNLDFCSIYQIEE
jgi:hypothetical protein